jgi:hypothetical protein
MLGFSDHSSSDRRTVRQMPGWTQGDSNPIGAVRTVLGARVPGDGARVVPGGPAWTVDVRAGFWRLRALARARLLAVDALRAGACGHGVSRSRCLEKYSSAYNYAMGMSGPSDVGGDWGKKAQKLGRQQAAAALLNDPLRGHTDVCGLRPDLCSPDPGESGLTTDEEVRLIGEIEALPPDDFYKLALDPDEIDRRGLGFLDWSNDGCSNSPDGIGGTSFLGPCSRHDFTYRNRSAWEVFTGDNIFSKEARRAADDRLAKGLLQACDFSCDWAAPIYWAAVHGYEDGLENILPWDGVIPGAIRIRVPFSSCGEILA